MNSLQSMSRVQVMLLVGFLLLLVGFVDYITGTGVSVSFFYLIPISIAAWRLGTSASVVTAVASMAFGIPGFMVSSGSSGFWVEPWNACMRLGLFLACGLSLASLKRTFNRLDEERLRSKEMAIQIINAQEEERHRIARELHDEASQALATLTLRIEEIRRKRGEAGQPGASGEYERELKDLKELAEQILAELRKLAFALRPTILEDLGLQQALMSLFRQQLRKRGILVNVVFKGLPSKLAPLVELTLFRVAQEAVSNIALHSDASRVEVELIWSVKSVSMNIRDNGRGFDPSEYSSSRHMGIFGMRERVLLLSGKFDLRSIKGTGTSIAIAIPLNVSPISCESAGVSPTQEVTS